MNPDTYSAWLESPSSEKYEEFLEVYVSSLTAACQHQGSLLSAFWTGDVPVNATLEHMVLAKAGRLRLQEKAKVCALLSIKT